MPTFFDKTAFQGFEMPCELADPEPWFSIRSSGGDFQRHFRAIDFENLGRLAERFIQNEYARDCDELEDGSDFHKKIVR
jgi:hypothetical protein